MSFYVNTEQEAKLKARAHGLILKTKKAMYASIRDTIKEEMTPAYESKIGDTVTVIQYIQGLDYQFY